MSPWPWLRSRLASARRRSGTLLLVCGLCACAWLTFLLPPVVARDDVALTIARPYDLQMQSWLAGRWDVPGRQGERIEVDGRYYLYFGPTPALLRLPFAGIVAAWPGRAVYVSLFLAVALGLCAAYGLLRHYTPRAPLHATLALLGPPLIIASRADVYHEAIAWGSGLALLAALLCLRCLAAPSFARLAGLTVVALLAVHARAIWLIAMCGLLGLAGLAPLAARRRASVEPEPRQGAGRAASSLDRPYRFAMAAGVALALLMGSTLGVYRAKFGRWGLVPPLDRHVDFQADPARLERAAGMFHLSNLRTGVYNYLSPLAVEYRRVFPWIYPATPRLFAETRLDGYEYFVGLPHAAGALLVLALAGIGAAWRGADGRGALLACLALGLSSSSLFLFVGLCGRYVYDFFPTLVLGGALGAAALERAPRARLASAALAALAAYNVLVCGALALVTQRELAPAVRSQPIDALARRIDAALGTATPP